MNEATTPQRDWFRIVGLSLGFIMVALWTRALLQNVPQPWIFLDNVNLIFHEAGHLIFACFGDVLRVLGGSLTQCLIPLICLAYFTIVQQFGSAAFSLFWLGDNLVNVSVYINDSQARALPLITGDPDSHDWHWLLEHFNILTHDHQIAQVVHFFGALAMLAALAWIAYLLYRSLYPPPAPQEGFSILTIDSPSEPADSSQSTASPREN